MNILSQDIVAILANAKYLGHTTGADNIDFGRLGTDIFIGKEPQEPANCITIYDTGGPEQNAKLALDESTVQIRSRNTDYVNGYKKLEAIKLYLEAFPSGPAGGLLGAELVGIWCSSNIAFLTHDKNNRAILTVNFRVIRRPNKVGNRL